METTRLFLTRALQSILAEKMSWKIPLNGFRSQRSSPTIMRQKKIQETCHVSIFLVYSEVATLNLFSIMLLHNPLCPSTCCGYVKAVLLLLLLTNLGPVLVRGGRGGGEMVGWLERGAPGREAWVWNTMSLKSISIEDKISIFRKLNNIM